MKKLICGLLAVSIFIAGCGGHDPVCVRRYIPGDERRSCAALHAEIQSIDNQIERTDAKRRERDTWNIIHICTGLFILVPWFMIDAKGSHEAEIAALQARQDQLRIFFADNGCDVANLSAPSKTEIQLAASKQGIADVISATNCGKCGALLTEDDGINIAEGQRICNECSEKSNE